MTQLASLMEQGLPPYAGGVLDQPAALMEAFEYIWSEQTRMVRESTRTKD